MNIDDLRSDESSVGLDLVDYEDTSSEGTELRPWNPAKIRITTKNFSLREIVEQIDTKDVDLAPDFQREFVWKRRQRTRLIESVLLGIPLPAFYFNQEDDGTYQVVDGVQRLSTIHLFMSNQHVLERGDLEYLTDLDGRLYGDLEPSVVRRFRSAQIVVHVIEPQTPDEVKYDIFSRVNTLGSPLSTQEIRHAMSKDRSRRFLGYVSQLNSFDEATDYNFWRKDPLADGVLKADTGRMMNRELVLRFCAFRYFNIDEYRIFASLDAYLVEYTRRIDGRSEILRPFTDEELTLLIGDFDRAMTNARSILGPLAFRRTNNKRRGPINRAIFEAQAVALADYPLEVLMPKKDLLCAELLGLFDDEEYARSVTVGTGAYFRVEYRLFRTQMAIREALFQ